ncbi:hypothetical protein [Saccharothrix syringae]|uniref:Uncharacterized protein n=1 Tax=Saccharothrix syringae TaxID=103733 RepID=A0A5Q0H0L8_SACSY|nr:hypothetical protein [Saccharothrix syringae]QFZ19748.1 hypothetical protein EKG83_22005 [Saccharothrix syringae]
MAGRAEDRVAEVGAAERLRELLRPGQGRHVGPGGRTGARLLFGPTVEARGAPGRVGSLTRAPGPTAGLWSAPACRAAIPASPG